MSKKHIILGLGLLAAFYGGVTARRGGVKERRKENNKVMRSCMEEELCAVKRNLEKLEAFTFFVHHAVTTDQGALERKHLEKIRMILLMYPCEEFYTNFFYRVQIDCRVYKQWLAQDNLLSEELAHALNELESYAAYMQYYSVTCYRSMVWAYSRLYNPHN